MENDISVKGYLGIQESTDSHDSSEPTHSEKNSSNISFTVSTEEDLPLAGESTSNLFLLCGGLLLLLFVVFILKKKQKTEKETNEKK